VLRKRSWSSTTTTNKETSEDFAPNIRCKNEVSFLDESVIFLCSKFPVRTNANAKEASKRRKDSGFRLQGWDYFTYV
jgi:hypothetical protein